MLFGVQFMRHKKKVHKYNDSSLFTKHPIPGHSRASDTPYPADLLFFSSLRASLHLWAIFFLIFSRSSSALSSFIWKLSMTYSVKWEGTKKVICLLFTTTFFKTVSARNSEKSATCKQLLGKPKKPYDQSPVVWKPIRANRGLNFNLSFFLFSLKTGIYPDNFHYSL